MKQTTIVSLLGILILIFCAAHGCKKPGEGGYINEEKGFSLKVPAGWDIEEGKMNTDLIAVSPEESLEDNFRENFNILVETLPRELSREEYFKKGLPVFREFAKEYMEHDSGLEKLDRYEFRWDIVSHKMGPLRIKVLQYLTVKDKKGYLITFSAADDKFGVYMPMFREIAKSFRFR